MVKLPGKNSFVELRPQRKTPNEMEGKLRKASKMYEDLFLKEIVKSMRSTVHKGGLIRENMAERVFQDKLDSNYVKEWGNKGGIGLANLIYDKVSERFGTAMGIRKAIAKPTGPISFDKVSNIKELDDSSNFNKKIKRQVFKIEIEDSQQEKVLSGKKTNLSKQEVISPWPGILLGAQALDEKSVSLKVKHENGLISSLTFKGKFEPGLLENIGKEISSGDKIGLLSPNAKELFWQIDKEKLMR